MVGCVCDAQCHRFLSTQNRSVMKEVRVVCRSRDGFRVLSDQRELDGYTGNSPDVTGTGSGEKTQKPAER